jgi:hypothetical protein
VERRSRCSLIDGHEFDFADEQASLTLSRLAEYSKHVAALGLLHDVELSCEKSVDFQVRHKVSNGIFSVCPATFV